MCCVHNGISTSRRSHSVSKRRLQKCQAVTSLKSPPAGGLLRTEQQSAQVKKCHFRSLSDLKTFRLPCVSPNLTDTQSYGNWRLRGILPQLVKTRFSFGLSHLHMAHHAAARITITTLLLSFSNGIYFLWNLFKGVLSWAFPDFFMIQFCGPLSTLNEVCLVKKYLV